MKKLIPFILIIILSACSLTTTSELSKNTTKWEDANITHERYSVPIGCFCAFMNDMPLTIEVKDGAPVSITIKDGIVVDPASTFYEVYAPHSTMDDIIAKLKADIEGGGADDVIVTYDPTYGYPACVSIDYITAAVDDEISYEITDYEILK